MAEEGKGGNGQKVIVISLVAIVLVLAVANIRFTSEVIFQWIPATISVLAGIDVPGSGSPEPNVGLRTEGPPGAEPVGPVRSAPDEQDESLPVPESAASAWNIFTPISIFVSLVLATGVIYATIRLIQIRMRERRKVVHRAGGMSHAETPSQRRWQRIVEQSASDNPNDWRLAILEADIMLDELLEAQGYHGDTMADKMKQVERSDFNTIELAWDAHKVRNRIAHEGAAHDLNQREVRRVIGSYERVFREFSFI